jgi:flagellar FliL protein
MAEDDDLDLEVEAPKKGNSNMLKILVFVLIGILVIGISVGVTWFLVSGSGDEAAPQSTEGTKTEAKEEMDEEEMSEEGKGAGKLALYIPVNPAFVVNLNDPESEVNYLQVGVTLMVRNEADKQKVDLHMPAIRHHLVLLLGDQIFAELKTSDGKKKLQEESLKVVQDAMKAASGSTVVRDLFLTNIVGQ